MYIYIYICMYTYIYIYMYIYIYIYMYITVLYEAPGGFVASPGVRGGFHGSDAQRAHVEAMRRSHSCSEPPSGLDNGERRSR